MKLRVPQRKGIGRMVVALLISALVVISAGGIYAYQTARQSRDKATLLLEVKPTYNHFPYFYGLDQGIYASHGIDLAIEPGQSDAQSVSTLAAGKVQFALADVPTAVWAEATSNVTNVRVVAIIYQRTFFSVYYNKADIQNFSDLVGKTGGANNPATSAQTKLFELLLQLNNMSMSEMHMEYASGSVTSPLLADGQLQFSLRPLDSFGDVQAAAAKSGIQIGAFPFEAYGLSTYGSALLTTTQMIQEDPSLVQRMVEATMQSIIGAVKNPEAAAAALVKYEPQLNETTALTGIRLLTDCCMAGANSTSDPLAYGWINPAQMQNTVNLAVEGLGISTTVNASNIYTDQFTHPP